jgi:excinuclease ABC subunit C
VFVDGRPEKSRYRTYKVRTGDGPDDFASMYEVLSRRFRRAREAAAEGQPETTADRTWALPDLIVIDGGKGQLGMALAAARDVGIDVRPGVGLSIVGLAKERDSLEGGGIEPAPVGAAPPEEPAPPAPSPPVEPPAPAEEPAPKRGRKSKLAKGETVKMPDRVFLAHAKDAILIRPNSAEMFILQHLRDEAHRFAVTFHRSQRRRLTLRSALAEIPGIGEARQRLLLRHFGSVKKIREASLEDLAGVPGMTRASAAAVFEHWKRQPAPIGDPSEDPTLSLHVARESGAASHTADAAEEDAMDSAFAELEADTDIEEAPDALAPDAPAPDAIKDVT